MVYLKIQVGQVEFFLGRLNIKKYINVILHITRSKRKNNNLYKC